MLTAALVAEGMTLAPSTCIVVRGRSPSRRAARARHASAAPRPIRRRARTTASCRRPHQARSCSPPTTFATTRRRRIACSSGASPAACTSWPTARPRAAICLRRPSSRTPTAIPSRRLSHRVATHSPTLIVDAGFRLSAPSLARWNPTGAFRSSLVCSLPHDVTGPPAVLRFRRGNYTPVAVVGPERWTVYRAKRRADAMTASGAYAQGVHGARRAGAPRAGNQWHGGRAGRAAIAPCRADPRAAHRRADPRMAHLERRFPAQRRRALLCHGARSPTCALPPSGIHILQRRRIPFGYSPFTFYLTACSTT